MTTDDGYQLISLTYLIENGVLEKDEEVSDDDDTAYTVHESYVVFLEECNPRDIIRYVTRFKDGNFSVILNGHPNHSVDEGLDGDCALVYIRSDLAAAVSKF